MDDSAAPRKMNEIAGGGAGGGDWGYLGPDGMVAGNGNPFPAFPFSTPASASMLLSMDSAAFFDLHAGFPSSSTTAPALPAFHDFGSSVVPFDDSAHFLGAPPPPPPPPAVAEGQKGDRGKPGRVLHGHHGHTGECRGSGGGGGGGGGRGKNKKGMPAKNLMAERRRRKKLNDRLYMLRSVVPKISKVEVRMREGHAVNIHMFCARKPGILLSTMRALESLGLDIEQAVISCFSGFAMDVFRAERCLDGPGPVAEDIKAVLMHSAGLQNELL
ncbi:hypothetical protein PR202_ga08417 [Eleusine coracana subsp. coracana]|uniref:BHLH domain-containing protein n=1 Tax=Eleusine coracana subsp. coracana TaxID=191504 RepID=A0AAV5BZY9_ELECO|nr:hypothetical protein PR202_ga08417 [Eleusine coracana subsp. coracana]